MAKPWTGSSSRRKGHNFERETAEFFRRFFPNARRGLAQTRNSGETADVEETPYWVECKRGKVNITAALRQAREQTDGRLPIVVYKFDRERVGVAMDLDVFEKLLLVLHPECAHKPDTDGTANNKDGDPDQ
jgi:hypothetical protein